MLLYFAMRKKKQNKPDVAKTKNTFCELINRVKITEQRFSDLEHTSQKAEEQREKRIKKKNTHTPPNISIL